MGVSAVDIEDFVAVVDADGGTACEPGGEVACPGGEGAEVAGEEEEGLNGVVAKQAVPEPVAPRTDRVRGAIGVVASYRVCSREPPEPDVLCGAYECVHVSYERLEGNHF